MKVELICKKEAFRSDGSKIMNFTKGNTYYTERQPDEFYIIEDDNGDKENFFNIDVMFKEVINKKAQS